MFLANLKICKNRLPLETDKMKLFKVKKKQTHKKDFKILSEKK